MVDIFLKFKEGGVMVSKKELVLRLFGVKKLTECLLDSGFAVAKRKDTGYGQSVIFNKSVGNTAMFELHGRLCQIMSDSLSIPARCSDHIESIRDLAAIQSIGEHHHGLSNELNGLKL